MSLRPWYNKDANYQTNAKSFMDYLARTNKFLEVLIEDYEIFQELILEEFKKLETDVTTTIETLTTRLDNIQEEMTVLFIEWLEDGTLAQIINDQLLASKVDKEYVDQELNSLLNLIAENKTLTDQELATIQTQLTALSDNLTEVDEKTITIQTQLTALSDNLTEVDEKTITNKERLNDIFINIKDFGAVGDGETDDTQAFEDALDVLRSLKGGTLYVPVGHFICKSNIINIRDSISIKGATKTRHSGTHGSVIEFYLDESIVTDTYGVQLQFNNIGMGIQDVRLIGDDEIKFGIHMARGCFNNTLRNVDVQSFIHGVGVDRSWNNVIEKVTTRLCEIGFTFTGTITSSTYTSLLAYDCETGFQIEEEGNLVYSTFMAGGTDHTTVGFKILGRMSNTNIINFGFEDYHVCYYIDSTNAFVNIYGFNEFGPSATGSILRLFNVGRLNFYGINFGNITEGLNLFDIRASGQYRGRIFSYGCSFILNERGPRTLGLHHVIQDGQAPYGFLKKYVHGERNIYRGLLTGYSFLLRNSVPTEGDKITMFLDITGLTVGGSVVITTHFTNGQYNTFISNEIEGVTITDKYVSSPNGRQIEITSTQPLDIKAEIIALGNTAKMESTATVSIA